MSVINSKDLLLRIAVALLLMTMSPVSFVSAGMNSDGYGQPVKQWKGVKAPLTRKGNYFLPTGFTFEAVIDGAIFSYNLLTPTVAIIEEDIDYLDDIVLPKGTRFIGVVQVAHSLDRINIDFQTCVFPDGQEIKINGMALSPDGSAGVKGKVEQHKDAVAAKVAMKSVLAGVQAGAAATQSIEGSVATGLSQEASSSLDVQSPKTIESISIEERAPIKIFVRERTEF